MAYRHTPRDTQCGLRAHSRPLLEELIQIVKGNRYDTEGRILMLSLRLRKRIAQVPIPAIYHGKNESSHYRPLPDSLRILWAFITLVAVAETGISFPEDFPLRKNVRLLNRMDRFNEPTSAVLYSRPNLRREH